MRQLSFLKTWPARILTLVLIAQAALFYSLSHGEPVPLARSFEQFPTQIGNWTMTEQGVMEDEVKQVLRGDDYLTRTYADRNLGVAANLFVAFFRTQRTGQAPHSPKNCLPGNGWIQTRSDELPVTVAGRSEPIVVNRYVVQKGDDKSMVIYWYQSRDRVVASEYKAKFFVIADALRYNRTDTALVRVVVPLVSNREDLSTQVAVNFIQTFYPTLRQYLPV